MLHMRKQGGRWAIELAQVHVTSPRQSWCSCSDLPGAKADVLSMKVLLLLLLQLLLIYASPMVHLGSLFLV